MILKKRLKPCLISQWIVWESADLGKASRISDAAGRYIEFCKSTFPAHLGLDGYKNRGGLRNGATYHIAPNVLRELGAE